MVRKFICCLSAYILSTVMVTTCTTAVSAADTSVYNFVQEDITSAVLEDTKQPNTSWILADAEIEEFSALLENCIVQKVQEVSGTKKYAITLGTENETFSILIYDTDIMEVSDTKGETITTRIDDSFVRGLNRLMSTQSSGYQSAPESVDMVEQISDWAVEPYSHGIFNSLIPQYLQVGFMNDNITREQFCDLIALLIKTQGAEATSNTQSTFEDCDSENVTLLTSHNIIMGKDELDFAPNDFLTREEAATILCRTLDFLNVDFSAAENTILFNDDGDISDWAKNSVYLMNSQNIMIGLGENMFCPQKTLTKEEGITIISRVYDEFFAVSEVLKLTDFLPDDITGVDYHELNDPFSNRHLSEERINELLQVFDDITVVSNVDISRPFLGYMFWLYSKSDPSVVLYIRENGSVTVKQYGIIDGFGVEYEFVLSEESCYDNIVERIKSALVSI